MLRFLYRRLLLWHPAEFRRRFGDEILDIFDCSPDRTAALVLIADGLVSLVRQWAFRAEFRHMRIMAADAWLFRSLASDTPRPRALLHGGLTTALLLYMAAGVAGNGGAPPALAGAHYSAPWTSPGTRAWAAVSRFRGMIEPANEAATAYYRGIRVLYALDADHDLTISAWEMFTAPQALRRLDTNADGALSPEECGSMPGPGAREFMRVHRVLAALDADHDGEISASEIANSAAALRRLDRNGDGQLTKDEVFAGSRLP
jgi:hypothetical protein